jgi:hypothetical protein
MWVAQFLLCTIMGGCLFIEFDDQREFATKTECEAYSEQKTDLVVEVLPQYGQTGVIYYNCEFKGHGLKA